MMDNPHFTKKHAHRNLFFELSSDMLSRSMRNATIFEHNILMMGHPALAKPYWHGPAGILPKMSINESLDVTRIYSWPTAAPKTLLLHNRLSAPCILPQHAGLLAAATGHVQ